MPQGTSKVIEQERFLTGKVAQRRYQRPWSLFRALAAILSLVPKAFSSLGHRRKYARRHRRRSYQCRKTLIRRLVSRLPRDRDGSVLWLGPGREKRAPEMTHSTSTSQGRTPPSHVQEDNFVSTAPEPGIVGGLAAVAELVEPVPVETKLNEATTNEMAEQQAVIDNVQRQIAWILSSNENPASKPYDCSGKLSKGGTVDGPLQRPYSTGTDEIDQWREGNKAQQMAAAAAALENILDRLTLKAVPHGQ